MNTDKSSEDSTRYTAKGDDDVIGITSLSYTFKVYRITTRLGERLSAGKWMGSSEARAQSSLSYRGGWTPRMHAKDGWSAYWRWLHWLVLACANGATINLVHAVDEVPVAPGLWRIDSVLSAPLVGVKKERQFERCFSETHIARLQNEPSLLFGDEKMICNAKAVVMKANRLAWGFRCTGPLTLAGHSVIELSEQHYSGEANASSVDGLFVGVPVKLVVKASRLGDCAPDVR